MRPDRDLAPRPMPTGPGSFPATGENSLATVQHRALARVVDWILMLAVYAAVVLPFLWRPIAEAALDGGHQVVLSVAWLAVSTLYEGVLVAWRGRTVGKLAVGIRVARLVDGRRPLWWQSGIRVLLPVTVMVVPTQLAQVAGAVVYLSATWDPMRRGWHDKAAGTVVVNAR